MADLTTRTSSDIAGRGGASGDQHPRVEDPRRVELGLDGAEHPYADVADLPGEPRLVVGADRVVVGDRRARGDDGVAGGGLGGLPLGEGVLGLPCGDGEVERATGLVDV